MYSVCILIYVSMYLSSYLSTNDISGLAARGDWEQFKVHQKMMIEWTQRYTPRPWLSEFGDAIGDRDGVNSEMHWEAVIEWVWRCTLRAVIEQVCRCTLRPWSSEFGGAIGDWDWVNSEIYWDAMIERVWRCTWRPKSSEHRDALRAVRCARCWDSIHWLVNLKQWECDEVTLPLKLLWGNSWWQSICREVRRKQKLHSGVNSKLREWRDDKQS